MDKIIVMTDPKQSNYHYEEAMKTLRTNVQYAGRNIKSILITSYYTNEGKSDITMQLAKEIGNMGKRVLLIDADIRKSTLISRYNVRQTVHGLSSYLSGRIDKESIINHTNFANMDIIFAGPVAPNPSELLEEDLFADLIREMREYYDYILIDTPPIGNIIDAAIVAKQCDGAILVIESELVRYKAAQRAKEQLLMSGCKVIGAVLNKVDLKKDKYYGRYDYYYSSKYKYEK